MKTGFVFVISDWSVDETTWRQSEVRHPVEMYASAARAIMTLTHLYTYDLDPLTSDRNNISAIPAHMMNICGIVASSTEILPLSKRRYRVTWYRR